MTDGRLVLVAGNGMVAAVLVNAGLAKLVVPDRLRRALQELRAPAGTLSARAVRLLAAAELAAGVGLLVAPLRPAGVVAVAGLGLCFALLGAAGRVRGSATPCGCLGGRGDRPLGGANIVVGLALVALLPVNLLAGPPPDSLAYSGAAAATAAVATVSICLWLHRELVRNLLRPGPVGRPAREAASWR